MKTTNPTLRKLDLSFLAINSAEELERFRKGLPTEFNAVSQLAAYLEGSLHDVTNHSLDNLMLDSATVLSVAMSTAYGDIKKNSFGDIASEAGKIANNLKLEVFSKDANEIERLINFCIALSDSASMYDDEQEELKKRFAWA